MANVRIFNPKDVPQKYIDEVLAPGYGDCEIGYKRIENNILMVCHYAFWPHMEAKMFRWWLSEGMGRPGGYAFWHPAHSAFDWAEKTEGQLENALEYHREYFGGKEIEGYHRFIEPSSMFDVSKASDVVSDIIVCNGETMNHEVVGGAIHVLRNTFYGCEMRYRSFNYYNPDTFDESMSRSLLEHGIYEFNETGEWLPGYYKRETQLSLREGKLK